MEQNIKPKILFLPLFVAFLAFADDTELLPPLLGHNLTPTSYTLKNKQTTVGTYVIGYGITDNWTVGTCPWLLVSYNMPMLEAKFAFSTDTFFQRISIDANYFKTFNYFRNLYKQESTFLRLTGTHQFNDYYSLNISVGHQYFFNDAHPFSLRLIPGNSSKTNLNISTLSELYITKRCGGLVELGLVGLTYSKLWLHTGISGFYSWNWGLAQLGFSRTVSLGQVPFYADGATAVVVYWHPEIQLQVFF